MSFPPCSDNQQPGRSLCEYRSRYISVTGLCLVADKFSDSPVDIYTNSISLRDRRMQVLAPYIASLSLEVPPTAPQEKILDKISAKLVAHTISKQHKEAMKQQRKVLEGGVTQEEIAEQECEAIKKLKRMEYIVVEHIRSF